MKALLLLTSLLCVLQSADSRRNLNFKLVNFDFNDYQKNITSNITIKNSTIDLYVCVALLKAHYATKKTKWTIQYSDLKRPWSKYLCGNEGKTLKVPQGREIQVLQVKQWFIPNTVEKEKLNLFNRYHFNVDFKAPIIDPGVEGYSSSLTNPLHIWVSKNIANQKENVAISVDAYMVDRSGGPYGQEPKRIKLTINGEMRALIPAHRMQVRRKPKKVDLSQLPIGGLRYSTVNMNVHFWVTCQRNFHGCDCDTYCLPNEQYTCDRKTGTKVCRPNYYPDYHCTTKCVPTDDYTCSPDGNKICLEGRRVKVTDQDEHGIPNEWRCLEYNCETFKDIICPDGKECKTTTKLVAIPGESQKGYYQCVPEND